jgi:hypothetical protein
MTKAMEIRALNDDETLAALKMPKFGALKPVRCSKCNHSGSFARRVFVVSGVPVSKCSDDVTQETIRAYIRSHFGIAHVFFESPGSGEKLYVDSAICPECQSTMIVFDIELTSDFFDEVSKIVGHPKEKGRKTLK